MTRWSRCRATTGWVLFVLVAQLSRLPRWIAGPGVIDARVAALSWLEYRPLDYDDPEREETP